ncbi:MAG: ABC transporter ATP-binding protein [Candidatus Sumerlaeota bacterium]|nr:ABC transporter ATP-binding protein [Candidatus Sumerlaeota bacterium]
MSDDIVVETRNLGRRFGRDYAVHDLTWQVRRGAVYGLLGLNGAGKSTTFRLLMGLLRPTEGEARVLGLAPQRQGVELKRRVGYVGESHCFYEWMTVNEVFAFVAHYRKKNWDASFARSLAERFALDGAKKLSALSKGMRAKVSLCLAIAFRPELLILDEPTGGLDPVARREFFEGILAEYQTPDRTILISSHLINEVSGIVDHIGILHEGSLLMDCPTEEFLSKVKGLRLHFPGDPPAQFKAEGITRYRVDGREGRAVTLNYREGETENRLKSAGAESVEVIDLNLEDAFVEFISERKPPR